MSTQDVIIDLVVTLNELDALKEITTITSEYPRPGKENTMAIVTEEYAVFWDPEKRRWNWNDRGRIAIERE